MLSAALANDPRVDLELREQMSHVHRIRAPDGKSPLKCARDVSNKYGRLPIWSFDVRNPKRKGQKGFVVASYDAFQDYYRTTPAQDRCFYEIILSKVPTRLYVDVDAQLDRNLALSEGVIAEMIGVLVHEITALANELRGTPADTPVPYTVLDSSNPSKLSKHLVFDFFLRNNYHCGAFMRRVRNRIARKFEKSPGAGDRDRDHPYYLWAEVKDPSKPNSGIKILVRIFFADLAVYTKRRNFRIYGSSKRLTGALPLLAEGDAEFNWDTYKKCILQRRESADVPVYDCLEDDGSIPTSTSNTYYLRTDGVVAPSAVRTDGSGSGRPRQPSSNGGSGKGTFQAAPHLAEHWKTAFPFRSVFDTLAPTPEARFRREYSFADPSNIWTKGKCFNSHAELRAEVLRMLPATIHIGGVRDAGSDAPTELKAGVEPFQPTIAFDVDIRDYAPFRPCCGSTGGACARCWPIAAFAQRTIEAFITYMKLGTPACFFSGSKGIHVWAIHDRRTPVKNTNAKSRRIIVDMIQSMVEKQKKPGESSGADDADSSGDATMADAVRYSIPDYKIEPGNNFCVNAALGDAANRAQLEHFLVNDMQLGATFTVHRHIHGRDSALLHVLWPRIDADVTASPAHKLKAPMCVHPRTSRACVWLKSPDVNPYSNEIDPCANMKEFTAFCDDLRLNETL